MPRALIDQREIANNCAPSWVAISQRLRDSAHAVWGHADCLCNHEACSGAAERAITAQAGADAMSFHPVLGRIWPFRCAA